MREIFHPRVSPWLIDDSEFYEIESFADQMRFLLRYAVLAPSTHNTQAWAFRVTDQGVEVFADYSRRMPAVDPDDRELLISIGAAITNFRVAAAKFGFDTTVLYDTTPEERLPVALIAVCETCAPDEELAVLFRAIRKRHTNRAPFNHRPIEPALLARLCDAIDRFPETLQLFRLHDTPRVADLVAEGERVQMSRPDFRGDVADWIRPDDGPMDGVPFGALGMPAFPAAGMIWFLRHFDSGVWLAARDRGLAETASALLLVMADDDRVSLIRAGEALEVLLLTIADVGLQYSFLNQAVTVDPLRDRLGTLAGASRPAQLLIRIGSAPPVEQATPRRPLEQVVARSDSSTHQRR